MDVEEQKSNTPQAEVLRRGAENLDLSHFLDRSEEDLFSYKLVGKNVGVILSHRKREMRYVARAGVDACGRKPA